jgi:hypothetical protein
LEVKQQGSRVERRERDMVSGWGGGTGRSLALDQREREEEGT